MRERALASSPAVYVGGRGLLLCSGIALAAARARTLARALALARLAHHDQYIRVRSSRLQLRVVFLVSTFDDPFSTACESTPCSWRGVEKGDGRTRGAKVLVRQ